MNFSMSPRTSEVVRRSLALAGKLLVTTFVAMNQICRIFTVFEILTVSINHTALFRLLKRYSWMLFIKQLANKKVYHE